MVTGDLAPDAIGHYHEQGTVGGEHAYRRHPSGFWLWWHDVNLEWNISEVPDVLGALGWTSDGAVIEDTYHAYGTATGTPTVAAYP